MVGSREGVGYARRQSSGARNDSRGVFVYSKLRSSSTKCSKKTRKYFVSRATEHSTMATHIPDEEMAHHEKIAVLQADDTSLRESLSKMLLGAKIRPHDDGYQVIGPKKNATMGRKNKDFSYICVNHSTTTK